MSARWVHDFMEVPASEVIEGDLLANHATVTKVVHGPIKGVRWGSGTYELAEGECFIGCGDGNPHGFAYSRTSPNSRLVVGRNRRRVAS